MSDETTPTETPSEKPQQQGEPAELGDAGKKAIDAERRRAAAAEKEAKALKARLDEIEAANLSELDKAKKAAADAIAERDALLKQDMRSRVALSKGVPADLVDRLRGDSEDELSADAEALMARINSPRSPLPDPTQGGNSAGTPALSTADLFAQETEL